MMLNLRSVASGSFALVLVGASFVSGCATQAQGGAEVDLAARDVSGRIPMPLVWRAAQAANGDVAVAYYDDKKRINAWTSNGQLYAAPFHPDGHNRGSSGLALAWQDDKIMVAFRDKEPERDIYVGELQSGLARLTGVAGNTLPLARFSLLSQGQNMGVTWFDEKPYEKNTYNIKYRELNASGTPERDAVNLFAGIYPVMAVNSKGISAAMSWVKSDSSPDGYQIIARVKTNGGDFSEPMVVANTGMIRPVFKLISSGDHFIAVWHRLLPDPVGDSTYRLEGAYSADGVVWNSIEFQDLDGHDVESLDMAADGSGNIALVAGVVKPKELVSKAKRWAYLMISHDHGKSWSKKQNLRADPNQSEESYSHARTPNVVFNGTGRLLVVWSDWRTLRSGLRYSYSFDAGKNWKIHDKPLIGGVSSSYILKGDEKSVYVSGGKLQLVYEEVDGDRFSDANVKFVVIPFESIESGFEIPGYAITKPNYQMLQARSEKYWQAMVDKDFNALYSMMDPFFRARVSLDEYASMAGRIDYSNPRFIKIDEVGPIGMTVVKVDVEVKPFVVRGKTLKLDKDDREIPIRWLWMDGDWYAEFVIDSKDHRYTLF